MPQDLTDDKSTLVQVMAWCRQATSHYLNQCWPRSPTPYGVTRPQWVKSHLISTPEKNHSTTYALSMSWWVSDIRTIRCPNSALAVWISFSLVHNFVKRKSKLQGNSSATVWYLYSAVNFIIRFCNKKRLGNAWVSQTSVRVWRECGSIRSWAYDYSVSWNLVSIMCFTG